MEELKVLSLFSGIGAFEKALTNKGIKHKLINYCEIDKWASKAYSLIHNVDETLNIGDIKLVNEATLDDVNVMTWGFPCTDISVQNLKGKGLDGQHSGLYYDGLRILDKKKPKFSIIENVDNLETKNNGEILKQIISDLTDRGYHTKYKVLNAVDYGIPQHRERIFIISCIDKYIMDNFEFPEPHKNNLVVKDFVDFEAKRQMRQSNLPFLNPSYYKEYKSSTGIKKVFDGNSQGFFTTDFCGRRMYSVDGVCPTLTTKVENPIFVELKGNLNANERLRLQGFDDQDYEKIKGIIPEAQIKKQAGNSICVKPLEYIFENLFQEYIEK